MSVESLAQPKVETNPELQPFFPDIPKIPYPIALNILQNMNNQEIQEIRRVSKTWNKVINILKPEIESKSKFIRLLNSMIGDFYNKEKFQQLKTFYNSLSSNLKLEFIHLKNKMNDTILRPAAQIKDSEFIFEILSQLNFQNRKKCILSPNNDGITPFHIATLTFDDKKIVGNVMLRTLTSSDAKRIENNFVNYGWNLDDVNPGVYDYAPPVIECPAEFKC
ncbi:MAG: hypothetical protein KR126chlam4_01244 [Candidatus Anoxychlamydiales bacterium]|nr:hypothetical protein [Candidatus Anoxychlamydiales bacterium]NGX41403.1 hypothetical protein [Candidatus Anoxychlamydiales bacterium]